MAPRNPAGMQQTGASHILPDLTRQLDILRVENTQLSRQKTEIEQKYQAAIQENRKDARKGPIAGNGDEVRLLQAECMRLKKEKKTQAAKNEKLKVDVKRLRKGLGSEQNRIKELLAHVSRLEDKSQVDAKKIQTLVRQIEFRNNTFKTKELEIQTLNSRLKKMATTQKSKPSLQSKKSRHGVPAEIQIGRQSSSPREFDAATGQPPQTAPNPSWDNHGAVTQHRGEQEPTPVRGYEPGKADWTFWTTADEYSGAEVLFQVERLNSDMLQIAASLSDDLDLENATKGGAESHSTIEAIKRTEKLIGPRLTSKLAASNSQYVNILTQTATQTALVLYIRRIICSWWPWDANMDLLLHRIYGLLYESKPQPVSGRWRQLTRTHLGSIKRINKQLEELVPQLTESLTNIIIATGYKMNQETVKQKVERFSDRIKEIIKLAVEVQRMIGEGITSCDFEITSAAPESVYDPDYMETVYSGSSPMLDKEPVVCTVDLGLVKRETVTKEFVLLKPKVLLPSAFV